MTQINYALDDEGIKTALDHLAQDCPHIKKAIEQVGYPSERKTDKGYPQLLRIIAGQQLSVKAAASIWGKIEALMDGSVTPEAYMALSDEALRGAGCSFQKIGYGRHLSEAVLNGDLDPFGMDDMSDTDILNQITAVKGFGRWSAEMYMIFALGRTDIWPVGDLAVRKGAGRILGLDTEPHQKEMDDLAERWRPHRSVVALLCWYFYANAPL